jgi:hypothetical protein
MFRHSLCTQAQITIYMAHSPCLFYLPLLIPFAPLSNPFLLTWNPPSCDRICPPWSQVACKLTSPFPTLSPNPPPSKLPEPRLPSASLRQPQEESGVFCPEQIPLKGQGPDIRNSLKLYGFVGLIRRGISN